MFRFAQLTGYAAASAFNASTMTPELDRAERRVEEQSVALKKPLGLGDLVLTQIVFVVGSSWVGTAAKLGTVASLFLAPRHFTLLHSASRRGHLSEPTDAVGRRNLPMGKARF